MDSELNIFLSNVTWLRKHNKLSKKRMAALLGIGVYSLNKIESGMLPPNLDVDIFFRIQRHFGIRPTDQLTTRLGK